MKGYIFDGSPFTYPMVHWDLALWGVSVLILDQPGSLFGRSPTMATVLMSATIASSTGWPPQSCVINNNSNWALSEHTPDLGAMECACLQCSRHMAGADEALRCL